MNEPSAEILGRIREDFDAAFARPISNYERELEDLLAIRIGDRAYALRLDQVVGLHRDRALVKVPTPVPSLLGLASFRGVLAPVYDTGMLLGHGPSESAPWFVAVSAPSLVALAVTEYEAHVRLPKAVVHSSSAVHVHGALRPIVHVGTLLSTIEELASAVSGDKE